MPTFECSAMLFDLDGVLVDSTPAIIEVWTQWCKSNGVDAGRILGMMHGRRSVEVLRMVAPHVEAEAEVHKIEETITSSPGGTVAVPGAGRLLRALPENRWAVATSGLRTFATRRLIAAGLPVPGVLVAADDVARGKPDPEPYLKAAELLNVRPAQCLVVEDAPAGILAGHAGGMKVLGLATTYPAAGLAEADAVVESLAQVRVEQVGDGLRVEV